MIRYFRKNLILAFAVCVFCAQSAHYAVEAFGAIEPASSGTYVRSKGTKAADDYEGQAGKPAYESGKGFQLGIVTLKPFIGYTATYEDNIFFEPSGKQDDLIHGLDTGFTAAVPLNGGQHQASLSYKALLEWFDRFSSQNHDDHTVDATLDLNFVPFSVNLRDTFKDTVSRADTEFTQRTERYENQFVGLVEIPFATFFLETEADDYNVQFRSSNNKIFDHNEFTIYERIGYDIAPSTQALAEYGYVNIDYDEGGRRDGDANQVSLGLRGALGTRMSYQAWGGTQWRIYDEDTRPDFNGFVFRGALQYDITETSNIVLKGNRNPVESTFDDQSFYTRNRVELVWKQQMAERLYLLTSGFYSYNEYSRTTVRNGQDKTRRDSLFQGQLRLEYYMPNDLIMLFAEYRLTERDSNLIGLDYTSNAADIGIKANF